MDFVKTVGVLCGGDSAHEFHIPVYVPNPVCERFLNPDRLIFKLHHSLLSRRQFCWVLTSEQKGECCRLAFSSTSGGIDCRRISHPPFTFQIQYTKTVCESGQILMHQSMICPRLGWAGGWWGGGSSIYGNLTSWTSPGWKIWPSRHLRDNLRIGDKWSAILEST